MGREVLSPFFPNFLGGDRGGFRSKQRPGAIHVGKKNVERPLNLALLNRFFMTRETAAAADHLMMDCGSAEGLTKSEIPTLLNNIRSAEG